MSDGKPYTGPDPVSQPADWEALARYLAGESSREEVAQLEARLNAQPADQALMDSLAQVTQRMAAHAPADIDVEAALVQVKARRSAADARPLKLERFAMRPSFARRMPLSALAAAAVFVIGIAGFLTLRDRPAQEIAPSPARMTATGVGVIDSLRLPDGTHVVLGPRSSLTIAANYGVER
jgi:transmembrane sensor